MLFAAVVGRLLAENPASEFMVRSRGVIPGFEGRPGFHFFRSESLLADSRLSKWRRLAGYASAAWMALKGCSRLVFCGGTLFHARRGSLSNLGLIAMFVILARLRGAKVFSLGAGVGPLPGAGSVMLMSVILFLSESFITRDATSFRNCRRLPGSGKVKLAADLVFTLGLAVSRPVIKGTIGITVAASDLDPDLERYPDFVAGFPGLLRRLAEAGWQIRLLSFQELDLGPNRLSDFGLFDRLQGGPGPWERVRVPSDPAVLADLFSGMEMVIGMRFHGLVLAAMTGRPFVGIGRDAKLSDLCGRFAMPFLALDGFTPDKAFAAVSQAKDIMPSEAAVTECRRLALGNFEALTGIGSPAADPGREERNGILIRTPDE